MLKRLIQRPVGFAIIIISLSLAIRWPLAIATYGTEDVTAHRAVADALAQQQNPYQATHFAHLPALWVVIIYVVNTLSPLIGVPFVSLIKLPPILADTAIAVVLYLYFAWRRGSPRTGRIVALLYAVNPISILIVAVHGQLDSIPTLFLLVAVFLVDGECDTADWFLAALSLGLAIWAKTWPVYTLPFFLTRAPGRKVAAVVGLTAVLPFAISVGTLYALAPKEVYARILHYGSSPGWWGFTSLKFVWTGSLTNLLAEAYAQVGMLVLIGAVCMLAFYEMKVRRPTGPDLATTLTANLLVFFVLTPGYGTQYMAWLVPFAFITAATSRLAQLVLILIACELLIEYVFRPYQCGLGEWVILPPDQRSICFNTYYGQAFDRMLTNVLRWPMWIACGVWLARLVRQWSRTARA